MEGVEVLRMVRNAAAVLCWSLPQNLGAISAIRGPLYGNVITT